MSYHSKTWEFLNTCKIKESLAPEKLRNHLSEVNAQTFTVISSSSSEMSHVIAIYTAKMSNKDSLVIVL